MPHVFLLRTLLPLLAMAVLLGAGSAVQAQPVAPAGYVLEPIATGLGDAGRIAVAPASFGSFGGQLFAARPSTDEILRIDPATGTVSSFATTIGETGFFVEFGTGGGFGEDLYVSNSVDPANPTQGLIERIDASGVSAIFGNPSPPPGPPLYQFGGVGMAFSTGGAFGERLYSGTGGGQISDSLSTLPPSGSSSALFADFSAVLNGTPTELRFGPDRAGFGTDLYVGLSVAASGATGVESGIYRFDATGTRTTFSLASADPDFTGAPSGLAFSGIGAFGGDLYACVNTDAIVRIDDAGDVDRFVESIGTCSSLAFSDDGQTMFFIESGTGTLWALRQVPPPNVSIGDFVVYEENFRGESGSSTSPEFDELGLSGFTGSTLPSGSGPDLTGRVAVYQIDGPSGEVAGRLTADASPLSDGSFSIRSQMSGLEAPPLLGSVAASQGASYADGPDTVAVSAEVSFTWDAMGLPQASLSVVEQRLPSGPIFTSEDALPAPMVTAMLAGDPFELTLEVDRSGASGLASAIVELDAGLSVSTGPLVFSIVTTGAFEDLRHAFGLDGIDFEPVRLTLERFEVTQPYAQSFSVDTTLDGVDFLPGDGFCSTSAAECSLRAAIQEANALPGATEIVLRPGTHTLTIPGDDEDAAATGDLDVLDDVGIRGDGPDVTIVDGNALDRVFHNGPLFFSTPTLRLEGVAVTGGQADDANNPTGGGIFSNGPLFLADCSISGNRANLGGGIRGGNRFSMQRCVVEANEAVAYFTFADGGGLDVERSGSIPIRAQVFDSAIVSNLAESGAGLGCSGFGSFGSSDRIWVENTTMSGNVNSVSGAQLSFANCSATVVQSTVVGDVGSGLRALRGALSSATLEIENSVISGTPACEPFSTLSPTLDGHNASADTSCGFNGPGDLEGVSLDLAPLAPLDTIEGLLASTRAHVPNPGSPLIEAADEARCTGFDQRRLPRPVDGDADGTALCDLGAIEVPEPRSWLGLGVGALGLAFLRRRSLVGAEATR